MTVSIFFSGAAITILLAGACQPDNPPQASEASYQGEAFEAHIRTTEARTPEAERQGFKLPEGFEIQLFAAEPDIGKPLNMAFDAQGRLWVTQSHEYPFPAEPGEGADRLSVLEDTDGDGRADRFTHYEDTLNIPMGVLPLADATLAYSIPNLYRFTDTDGDTQANRSEVLLGPFGHRDTHGMVNNLTRGYDGWVHTCHGFTNTSSIAGNDGDSITMTSGNTFRFRPDGSRVEQTTFGQVNPFGLAYDEWGYLYSTDCHTSPIYQLIRGADYPHFGKKEVGIGFAPDTKPHGAESTALSGLAYYAATQFPEAYRDNFYIGDVVTCRIHRNSFTFQGSTPVAKAEEDLVKSDDPWFRPVDIKLGPDGALYVADFYNSIIGHYEVPLDHPKRDKVRGRIWRITYRGEEPPDPLPNLSTASVATLIATLDHDNLAVRMSAADELADRVGPAAVGPLTERLQQPKVGARAYVLALWVLHRLDALDETMLREAATQADPTIKTHTLRILREIDDADHVYYPLIVKALGDKNPHVQRAAAEVIANYPSPETVEHLLTQAEKVPDYDSHYRYTVHLMLRNLLRDETLLAPIAARRWSEPATETLADVLTGVDNTVAGHFMFTYLSAADAPRPKQWQHAVRFVPTRQVEEVVRLAQRTTDPHPKQELAAFQAVQQGLEQRGANVPRAVAQWGAQLAERLLAQYVPSSDDTASMPLETVEELTLAATLAGTYTVESLTPTLKTCLQKPSINPTVKVAMAKTLLQIAPQKHSAFVRQMLENDQPAPWKRNFINVLGEMEGTVIIKVLADSKALPPDLQRAVALALAASEETREVLFEKVRAGDIFARALVDAKVKERLLLNISPDQLQTFETLTAKVPTGDDERNDLIEARLANFTESDTLAQPGVTVFSQHCKACHRVSNEGGMIGPQLTGIGSWGAEALATKIIDPNRNISEAFRTYTIKTKDGQVMTGLYRRDAGEVRVFARMSGEEFSVPKNNIAEQQASPYTLMPDHFGETLSQEDFNALLSYLLSMQSQS